MVPPDDHGAFKVKNLRVLLPFSHDSLRIPDELADEICSGNAVVVGQYKGEAKVWSVEVGQDSDGAFLGRGWQEFVDACGVGAGWLLVLRHRGRGVLTVKAFDNSCFLTRLGSPSAARATMSSTDASRRPQFISVLPLSLKEKMLIPSKFVEQYIPKEHLHKSIAIVLGPLGKVCPIELEMNGSDMFFAGGWSKFVACHGITEADSLLLRYEGNMVFTVKVFGPDGFQNKSKHKDIRMQQCVEEKEAVYPFTRMCKSTKDWPSSDGQSKPKVFTASLREPIRGESVFDIGPPSWIKRQISANALKELCLARAFCDTIGLRDSCTITLKTSMHSNKSWQLQGFTLKNKSYYRFRKGWRKFCKENSLEIGDICTFNVVETTVWHVVVTRCKDNIN